MGRWIGEHMQVRPDIVQRLAVDVVDDLAPFRAGDLSVLPIATRATRTVTQAARARVGMERTRSPLNGRIARRSVVEGSRARRDHAVTAPRVDASGEAINLSMIGVQRVAVKPPHLVVPRAHLTRHHGSHAVAAGTPDDPATPAVIGAPVTLLALVVHQAQAVRRVASAAIRDRADTHGRFVPYQADGKSWISRRIAIVHELEANP